MAKHKPWSGRFTEPTDAAVEAFTASVDFDRRLYVYDIMGSIAHAQMLAKVGVLTKKECDAIVQGPEGYRSRDRRRQV
jgi:argininosuccinate lyase